MNKRVVVTVGRFQPPHLGHLKLFKKMVEFSNSGDDIMIFPTDTYKKATGTRYPLEYQKKIGWMKKLFGDYSQYIQQPGIKGVNPFTAMTWISDMLKYNEVLYVVGGDRVEGMEAKLHDYNSTEEFTNPTFKKGDYAFENIDIRCAGGRNPESEGVDGASGTKMREAATVNTQKFIDEYVKMGLKRQEAMKLMAELRDGMNI